MKKTGIIVGLLLAACGVIPALYRVFNTGSAALLLAGLFVLFLSFRWSCVPRAFRIWSSLFLCLCFLVSATVSAFMVYQAWFNRPPAGSNLPAIVLGGRVYDSGPSLIVARRLDAAAAYLALNPLAYCVVSGGKGEDERRPEAEAMSQYLISRHEIDPGRIILEDKSSNTLENIRFSKALLNGEASAVIVSDPFHQLRAGMLARSEGLTAFGVSSFTPPGLLPAYWTREILGVLYTAIITRALL